LSSIVAELATIYNKIVKIFVELDFHLHCYIMVIINNHNCTKRTVIPISRR